MKVTLERLPESRVLLDIEVDAARLEKSLQVAYKRVANRARIPGFRPGKAPRPIVERMIGREGLIREALDDLVPLVYNEVLEEQEVDAVDQPELEIVELDPVRFKATVPVRHTVDLGDYQSIKIGREPVEVTGEMVEEQVEHLRQRFASQVPVDRPAAWGDFLIADVVSTVDDEEFVEDRDAEFPLKEGDDLLLPGLAEAFIGMSRDEEKELDLEIPGDFQVERFQGKTAHFKLTLKDVKEASLPDLDDDFAQQINETEFPTLDVLRERIEADLKENLDKAAEGERQQQAVDRMVEMATIEYPRVYVEREIDVMVRDTLGNDRDRYLGYLARVGQSEAEFRESLVDDAELRVKRSLVLSAFAEKEGIDVTEDDVDAELDKLIEPAGDEAAALRNVLNSVEGRATMRRTLLSGRTLGRISELVATDGAAPEAASVPATTGDSAEEPGQAPEEKEDAE